MAGLLILAVIGVYVFLSKFIIKKVYEKTQSVKMKYIALAVMVLIPTWDIVLGYPIYAYLCLTKAGVHIYKTIDNVEGFYVGEEDTEYEPYEPYKGYKYIEYQEVKHQKPTGKYYRSYWVNFWEDTNAAKNCVFPRRDNDDYAKAVKRGHCIVKEEIEEGEVTGLWKVSKKIIKDYYIWYLRIRYSEVEVINPLTKEKYFSIEGYLVDKSWVTGILNISSGEKGKLGCNNYINWDNSISSISIIYTINKTLKGKN